MVVDEITGDPLPIVDKESLTTGVGWAPEPFVPAPYAEVQAQSSSLAASVSSSQNRRLKRKKPPAWSNAGTPGFWKLKAASIA